MSFTSLLINIILILLLIIFCLFFILIYIFKLKNNKNILLIEIEKYKLIGLGGGPLIFNKGLCDILPYKINNCLFIASSKILPINAKNKSNYFYISYPNFNESIYEKWISINKANKLILGPNFVPNNWYLFPNKNIWKERRFYEILKNVKGIAVHTNKVKNYLANVSNTKHMLNKYKIIRPCTNLRPSNVKNFNERNIDIIFFEKYTYLNHHHIKEG